MEIFDCIMAVAECRNITKAAEQIFMTQPALTLRLNRFEQKIGVKIFDRSKTPVELTPAGYLYITEMKKIRMMEESLYNRLRVMGTEPDSIRLTIGMGFNRGKFWFPPLLSLLQKNNSKLIIQTCETTDVEMENMILKGTIDIGVAGSVVAASGICAMPLGREEVFLGIPDCHWIIQDRRYFPAGADDDKDTNNANTDNDYPISAKLKRAGSGNRIYIDPADLSGECFIMGKDSYGLTRYTNLIFSRFKINPGKIINVGNTETAYLLAASGIGIVFTFQNYHQNLPLTDPSMVRPWLCSLKGFPMYREVYFLCRREEKDSPLIQTAYHLLKDLFEQMF